MLLLPPPLVCDCVRVNRTRSLAADDADDDGRVGTCRFATISGMFVYVYFCLSFCKCVCVSVYAKRKTCKFLQARAFLEFHCNRNEMMLSVPHDQLCTRCTSQTPGLNSQFRLQHPLAMPYQLLYCQSVSVPFPVSWQMLQQGYQEKIAIISLNGVDKYSSSTFSFNCLNVCF